jgi:hypothetical protein
MKHKVVATILFAVLLISTVGVTANFATVTASPVTYFWLTIETNPLGLYVWPSPPAGNHTSASWVNVTAPAMIDLGAGARAVFQSWSGGHSSSGTYSTWVVMDANKTVTANYKIQYLLTVISPHGTTYTSPGSGWVDANTNAWAGVTPASMYVSGNVWVLFDHWSGDASGTSNVWSNAINMTGPKTAVANWKYQYFLKARRDPAATYPEEGWYWHCNWANWTVPDILSPAPPSRWKFTHWNLDGSADFSTTSINVHMDTNHTVTVYYKFQWQVILTDNRGNASGIAKTFWWDDCTNCTFSAPDIVTVIPGAKRFKFNYWFANPGGNLGSQNPISIHVGSGLTMQARYDKQFYATVNTSPLGLDAPTGEGWYNSGSTITVDTAATIDYGNGTKHVFQHWSKDGVPTAGFTPWSLALTNAHTFTAVYKKEYLIQWDTNPTGLVPSWKGSAWVAAGSLFKVGKAWTTGVVPGSANTTLIFYEIEDNGVGQGVGTTVYNLDGGSLAGPHNLVAVYKNQTAFFISPGTTSLTAPKFCTDFSVTITAANFDEEYPTGGKDLYALDFHVYWNNTLIKLVKVDLSLDQLWGAGNFFVAQNTTFSGTGAVAGWDYYWLAATALGSTPGFVGTRPVVTLTFHVELDPCFPTVYSTPIDFSTYYPMDLRNSTNDPILPDLKYGATYTIAAPQPMVVADPSSIVVTKNVPQTFFDVDVKINLGIKVTDFKIWVTYPNTLIDLVNVTIGNYLPGPAYDAKAWWKSGANKVIVWVKHSAGMPHAMGNGTLFTLHFKVIKQIFWPTPNLVGAIGFDKALSYLSVCCPSPKIQQFNPDVASSGATYTYDPMQGDLNFDGIVNVADLLLVAQEYCMNVPPGQYDLDSDNHVGLGDLVLVAMEVTP